MKRTSERFLQENDVKAEGETGQLEGFCKQGSVPVSSGSRNKIRKLLTSRITTNELHENIRPNLEFH